MVKQAAPAAVVAPAPVAKAPVVAVRGGLAIATVRLTGKQYRVAASHNKGWWDKITAACATDKQAGVAALVQAGVPAIFVGYAVRRGYLAPVTQS